MPRRSYRVNPLGAEESRQNYIIGVEGKDQPNWAPEFRALIEQRYGSAADYFNGLRRSVTEYLRGVVPRGLIPNYIRFALKAAKLAMAGTTENEYYAELANVVVKNGLDLRVLRSMFESVDELKKIRIDWGRLERVVRAVAAR